MGREFIMPGKIVSGSSALFDARVHLKEQGKKALIVTDEVMVKLGNVKVLTSLLDEEKVAYGVFDGISGEPTDTMIEAGLKSYQEEGCDFLIALGGGSPIDSMKAIAALSACG